MVFDYSRPPRWIRPGLAAAAIVLGSLAPGATRPPQTPTATPATWVITGARILDPAAGRYLAPAAVVIEAGRIKSVTAKEPAGLPADVRRLDLEKATLVPGLIDARAAVAPTPEFDTDQLNRLGLAHGVTGYRALNLRTAWAVTQRRRIDAGLVRAPRLWVGGQGLDRGARPDLWLADVADAKLATAEVARQAAAGVDWVAGYDHLPADIYRAMVAAVKGTAVRVAGMPGAASLADLAAAGVHSIETLAWPLSPRPSGNATVTGLADRAWIEAPARDLNALASKLAAAGVALVPMLAAEAARAFPADVEKDPSLAFLPDARRAALIGRAAAATPADTQRAARAFAARSAFLARFLRARGRIVTGSGFDLAGSPLPGVGVHTEMAALVRAGLTPADAIRAATVNAAAMVGAEQALGAIAPGRDADFFVVQGDPLARIGDLVAVLWVVRRGEVLDPKSLR